MHCLPFSKLNKIIDTIALVTSLLTGIINTDVNYRPLPAMPATVIRISSIRNIDTDSIALFKSLHYESGPLSVPSASPS